MDAEGATAIEGRVTGIAEGAITGWVSGAEEDCLLEAVVDGGEPFGRARPALAEDGQLRFVIPIPEELRDGRMRFLDVRPIGGARPLDGGPVIYDGGLFDRGRKGPAEPLPDHPLKALSIEGAVEFVAPRRLTGWAWAPEEPSRRVRLEILAGGRFVAAITADKPRKDLEEDGIGDGRYGFEVDLARVLRRGPHLVSVRAVGSAETLTGGDFTAGPFAADGEVDCPGYLDDEASRALLETMPFEHLAYNAKRMASERLVPRLINRLRRERLAAGPGGERYLLLLLPGEGAGAREGWALQSHPRTATAEVELGVEAIRKAARQADRVLFARPGDLIHPSAVTALDRMRRPEVVSWNRFCADEPRAGSAGLVLRRPAFDVATVRQGAVTDTTLAVRGETLAGAPEDVIQALAAGRLHPLWFWLTGRSRGWLHHPEALTSSVGPPPRLDAKEVLADEGLLRRILAEEGEASSLERLGPEAPFPFALTPQRRAKRTSVLVGFRNRSALTLRCLHAISRQQLTGELELVLVDNQSDPAELEAVLGGARRLFGEARCKLVSYDLPFNHSAQNNLAARSASGEVVVICNNDVVLEDPLTLEQLGAWALGEGVGTVGCRLWDPERRLGSHGHVHSAPSEDPFQPPLRETSDPSFGEFIHACAGNTLALAAMARERFLGLGGLDENRFPVGYNDIDLMLRASAAGLTHLYLGHLRAQHARGSSRTGDNEDLQALWVRQAVSGAGPWLNLEAVRVETARPKRERKKSKQSPEPLAQLEDAALAASLKAAIDARREVEQRRAELAEAFAKAAGLVDQLGEELKSTRPLD